MNKPDLAVQSDHRRGAKREKPAKPSKSNASHELFGNKCSYEPCILDALVSEMAALIKRIEDALINRLERKTKTVAAEGEKRNHQDPEKEPLKERVSFRLSGDVQKKQAQLGSAPLLNSDDSDSKDSNNNDSEES